MDRFEFKNRWPSPRVPEGDVRAISRSLRFSPQRNPAKLSHTIPKIDVQRIRLGKLIRILAVDYPKEICATSHCLLLLLLSGQ